MVDLPITTYRRQPIARNHQTGTGNKDKGMLALGADVQVTECGDGMILQPGRDNHYHCLDCVCHVGQHGIVVDPVYPDQDDLDRLANPPQS